MCICRNFFLDSAVQDEQYIHLNSLYFIKVAASKFSRKKV
jgi:hypothetical protein